MKMAILLVVAAMTGSVNAQEKSCCADKHKVETNGFWSNWFISAGGGAQVYFGSYDSKTVLSKRLAPSLDVSVGKWFTPGIGLRVQYSGLQAKGVGLGTYTYGDKTGDGLYRQKWNMGYLHGDILLNASNMLFGYNESRVYNLIPFVGFGGMRIWDSPKKCELAATVGIINRFRLSSALDLNLEAKGSMVNGNFDGEPGNCKEGLVAVTVGLTYKFSPASWNKPCAKTTGISQDDMDRVREQLNGMLAENKQLKDELVAERNRKPQTVVEKELVNAQRMIQFSFGKSSLSKAARVNLKLLAEGIKKMPADKVFTVTGYADNKTGSKKVNEKLSKARAEAVRKALVEEFGVRPEQIRVDYKGGVDNMFYNDARLSRVVIAE